MTAAGSESRNYEPIDSNDDTIELDVVNPDDIIELAIESSNSTVNNFAEELVDQENENTDVTSDMAPWKIIIEPNQGCDDTEMFVPVSGSETKRLCCVYCLKTYPKLARHLYTAHKDKADVKRFCNLPAGSKKRKKIIDMIMKKGQIKWNSDAKLNKGKMQTCRRPNLKFNRKAADFDPCPKCFGALSGKSLSHHFKTCSNNALQGERKVKELSRATGGRAHPNACDDLRKKILPKMRANASVQLIRFDWLIIEFGNGMCLNYFRTYQHNLIRSKLRASGKLLVAAKSISTEISDFSSLFHVKHCNLVVEAIQKITKFDFDAKRFGSPGTATTLVTLIKAIGDLLLVEYMKLDELEKEKEVERFLKVFTKETKLKINKLAKFTQAEARRSKKLDIPSTDDVSRFATYLDGEREKLFAALSQDYSYEIWQHLSEVTLASILVYNRRRVGDMMNIKVSAFDNREIIASYRDKLVPGALPEYIAKLVKTKMIVRGKLDNDVPVLLKHHVDDCIQLLLRHRNDARISNSNIFLFALYSPVDEGKTVDACAILRTHSERCSAENPGSLRGTKLRKHMASICGTLNLTDQEVTNVAKYMGHSDPVHRNIYRHNTLHSEVIQMTDILEAAQGRSTENTNNHQQPPIIPEKPHTLKGKSIKTKTNKTVVRTHRARTQRVMAHRQRKNRKTPATTTKRIKKESTYESFPHEDSHLSDNDESELSDNDESELSDNESSELSDNDASELSDNEASELSDNKEAKIINSKTSAKSQKNRVIIRTKQFQRNSGKQTPKTKTRKSEETKIVCNQQVKTKQTPHELGDPQPKTNEIIHKNRIKANPNRKPPKTTVTYELGDPQPKTNEIIHKNRIKAKLNRKPPKTKASR